MAFDMNMNFYHDIEIYKDRIAVVTDAGRAYTYAEMLESADQIAQSIPTRSLVFLVCNNCYESVAAYIGFLRKQIVPVLINPKIDDAMLSFLMESYQPQYVFCPRDWHGEGEHVEEFDTYHLLRTGSATAPAMNPELAVLITTSGSTGSPKLVMQSYKNINANAQSIVEYLGITKEDRAITTMPMSYTFGLSIIQSHLMAGARIVVTEKTLMDKGFWALLKEQEVTTFGGVPYIYEMLKRLRFARMELPSLRYVTQAGGKLSKELVLEFAQICRDKGMKFIVMYGQTEATARMAYMPWEFVFEKTASMGIAIPGGKFSLIDADGALIQEDETVGELVYEGDNVTLGYALSAADLANPDQRNGVLQTGDMAKRDKDGFYYIVGRKKRFLKIYGNRVNLDETEGILNKEGFRCVCGGRDDQLKIYLEASCSRDPEEAIAFISSKIGLNRSAFAAVVIDEIPRNDSGKVLYSKLEELYG